MYPIHRRSKHYDYTIETFADFQELQTRVNNSTESSSARYPGASNGSGFAGKRFRMTNDINFNNFAWTGIGNSSNKWFQGNFDGGGFSILNFNLSNSLAVGYNAALFYGIKNAQIHDLSIYGNITLSSNILIAVLVAIISENCSIERIVNYTNVSSVNDANIIGHVNTDSNVIISDIINVGNLTSRNYNSASIVRSVASQLHISRVCNFGKISIGTSGNGPASGIVSGHYGSVSHIIIENCYNAGALEGTKNVNGITNINNPTMIPTITSSIKNCYNIGTLTKLSSTAVLAAISPGTPDVLQNNYYDSSLVVDGSVYNSVAKTTQELKSGSLFADGVWIERAGKFPVLPFMQNLQDQLLNQ